MGFRVQGVGRLRGEFLPQLFADLDPWPYILNPKPNLKLQAPQPPPEA